MLDDPRSRKLFPRLMAISQVGLEMAAPALVGLLLDRWLGTTPWLVVVGAVLGLTGGLVHLVQLSTPPRKGDGEPKEGRLP